MEQSVIETDAYLTVQNTPKVRICLYSRQVFLLTDGAVSDRDRCVSYCTEHSKSTRFFTFGIGQGVDKSLVTDIAVETNGQCEFVNDSDCEDVVMKQLIRAMKPAIADLSVHLDGDSVKNSFRSPFHIPPVFNGDKVAMYIHFPKGSVPSEMIEVELSGFVGSTPFKQMVKVEFSSARNLQKGDLGLISSLFGFSVIQDLEKRRSQLHDAKGNLEEGVTQEQVNEKILDVSLRTGILSRFTAFVAIEEREGCVESVTKLVKMAAIKPFKPISKGIFPASSRGLGRGRGGMGLGMGGAKRHRKVLRDNIQGITKPAIKKIARRGGIKRVSTEVYEESRSSLKGFFENVIKDAVTYTENSRRKTITTSDIKNGLANQGRQLYGLQSKSNSSKRKSKQSKTSAKDTKLSKTEGKANKVTNNNSEPSLKKSRNEIVNSASKLSQIIGSQNADGRFNLSSLSIVGINHHSLKNQPSNDIEIIATMLICMILESKFQNEKNSWFLVVKKAKIWMENQLKKSSNRSAIEQVAHSLVSTAVC
eukprot:TRINITY_DN4661_c0_g1_i1.p1 TRINITY_DN4661_c0_g1~~TRINITY_DN4661_c0_g1_i1.p1  ORF type:complete len:534 (+),score=116.79 TRINITY_DN4661_c0_g1_i1:62-1663(+)